MAYILLHKRISQTNRIIKDNHNRTKNEQYLLGMKTATCSDGYSSFYLVRILVSLF